jgi:hypothetical protein
MNKKYLIENEGILRYCKACTIELKKYNRDVKTINNSRKKIIGGAVLTIYAPSENFPREYHIINGRNFIGKFIREFSYNKRENYTK